MAKRIELSNPVFDKDRDVIETTATVYDGGIVSSGEDVNFFVGASRKHYGPFPTDPMGNASVLLPAAGFNGVIEVEARIGTSAVSARKTVNVVRITLASARYTGKVRMIARSIVGRDKLTVNIRTEEADSGKAVVATLSGTSIPMVNGIGERDFDVLPQGELAINIIPSNGDPYRVVFHNWEPQKEIGGPWYFKDIIGYCVLGVWLIFVAVCAVAWIREFFGSIGETPQNEISAQIDAYYQYRRYGVEVIPERLWIGPLARRLFWFGFLVWGLFFVSRVDNIRRRLWRRYVRNIETPFDSLAREEKENATRTVRIQAQGQVATPPQQIQARTAWQNFLPEFWAETSSKLLTEGALKFLARFERR